MQPWCSLSAQLHRQTYNGSGAFWFCSTILFSSSAANMCACVHSNAAINFEYVKPQTMIPLQRFNGVTFFFKCGPFIYGDFIWNYDAKERRKKKRWQLPILLFIARIDFRLQKIKDEKLQRIEEIQKYCWKTLSKTKFHAKIMK